MQVSDIYIGPEVQTLVVLLGTFIVVCFVGFFMRPRSK